MVISLPMAGLILGTYCPGVAAPAMM